MLKVSQIRFRRPSARWGVVLAVLVLLVGGGVGIALANAGGEPDPEPASALSTPATDPPTPPADSGTPDATVPLGTTDLSGGDSSDTTSDDDTSSDISDDDTSDDDSSITSDDDASDEDASDDDASDEDTSDDVSDEDDASDDGTDKDCRTTKYIPTEPMVFEQGGDRVRIWRNYSYGWRINYQVNDGDIYYVDVQKQLTKGNTPGIYGTEIDDGDFTIRIVSQFGTGVWNGEVTLTQTKFKMVLDVCGDWEYVEGFTNVW